MKLMTRLLITARLAVESVSFRRIAAISLLGVFCLTLGIGRASAAQLTWDPLNNGGNPPANGNWDTTVGNKVWAPGNVAWTQGSTTSATMGATFGGADGTWAINVDAGQVAVNSLIVNNSGYTFSGSPIYIPSSDILSVAAGKTVTFNCNFATPGGSSAQFWTLGSGSIMNVGGTSTLSSGAYHFAGADSTSAFNLNFTGANSVNNVQVLGPVNLTSGSITTSSAGSIGYPNPNTINGVSYTVGTLTVSGSATFTPNGNFFFVGREFAGTLGQLGGQGTLIIKDSGTVNAGTGAAKSLAICYDGGGAQPVNVGTESGTVNVNGGILNVGTSSFVSPIYFFQTSCYSGETAILSQTSGTINAWGGISFGAATVGVFAGGVALMTNTGGILNIGANGITQGAGFTAPNTFSINLSGGTLGALQAAGWGSSLPMTLGTANGNITFNCSYPSGAANILLTGALTGSGGLNVTGAGTLVLSGANNYGGTTLVSNGTLAVSTSLSPVSGDSVTLDGTSGPPTVVVSNSPGAYWSMGNGLTFQNGATALTFQFGSLPPSPSVAPLQVTGSVTFSSTPAVNINGSTIAKGTYPLIKYTGTAPATASLPAPTFLGGSSASAGSLVNNAGTKTISLVVTTSSVTAPLYWAVGNNTWDTTSPNWKQSGAAADYSDGDAVIFDDTASGSSPITVTLSTTVNPLSVAFNNSAKNYTITGSGSIASGALNASGSGTVTLSGTNSYTGGSTISAGQLNINNGGDPTYGTAIGTGPLTINAGATIDNTSGSDVTLQFPISENWNGNFTYAGSANNFSTGAGAVTMNGNLALDVNAENFIVGGSISDSGNNYKLNKTGNGTLTLAAGNSFGGGLTLSSGQLNLGDPSAAGTGTFTIAGGTIDNSSGGPLVLSGVPAYNWNGSFTYLGSANNLDLGAGAAVNVLNGIGNMTVNVANGTFSTDYDLNSGNTLVIKAGTGIWNITGTATGANSLGLRINAGQVNLARFSGRSIGASIYGMTVNANGLAIDMNNGGQVLPGQSVTLSGGVWDLNGFSENIAELTINSSGTLRDGDVTGGTSTLTISGNASTISGTCQFDVPAADATLNLNGALGGSGSLVKTGLGVLNLNSNNTYTGNTTVSSGTLSLSFPCLANTSTVTIATNAMLQLNFTGANGVATLVLNGTNQPAGIYNATTTPDYFLAAGTGSLQVGSSVPTSPTNITFSVSGNTLSLSWPSNYVGWILQTNVINVGVSNDWFNVPGSETNTQLAFPMTNPAISNEFFRLRLP
jgi:autotransporter-associated beta strand protein